MNWLSQRHDNNLDAQGPLISSGKWHGSFSDDKFAMHGQTMWKRYSAESFIVKPAISPDLEFSNFLSGNGH